MINVTSGQFYLLCTGQGGGGLAELSVKLLKMIQTQQLLLGLVAGGAVSSPSGALKSKIISTSLKYSSDFLPGGPPVPPPSTFLIKFILIHSSVSEIRFEQFTYIKALE